MRATLVLGLLVATAVVAAPKPRIVVDAPAPMKALLTKALKKKFTPVPAKSKLPDEPDAAAVQQAARAAKAVGVVTARLDGGSWAVLALNGADGAALGLIKFKPPKGKKKLKALPKGTDKRLESALARAKAPGKAEPKKEEPKKEEPAKEEPPRTVVKPEAAGEAPKEEPKKEEAVAESAPAEQEAPKEAPVEPPSAQSASRPVALNLGVGLRLFGRRLFYEDDLFKALSTYSLKVGPALQLEADWYPGAHFTPGPGAHIGLSVGFNYAFGIISVATDKTRYATTAMRLRVGLTGRISLGKLLVLQPHAGWALQTFNVANGAGGTAKPNIPNVSYNLFRAGLGTRVNIISPVAITAGFAYQVPLATGEIGSTSYFPRLKAGGLDSNFGVAIGPLFNRAELRLGVEYIRYWYSLNPEPGDPLIAGGATDDSFGGSLIVAVIF